MPQKILHNKYEARLAVSFFECSPDGCACLATYQVDDERVQKPAGDGADHLALLGILGDAARGHECLAGGGLGLDHDGDEVVLPLDEQILLALAQCHDLLLVSLG